jgi:predicted DNA-binding transcriptional regulator AlpA
MYTNNINIADLLIRFGEFLKSYQNQNIEHSNISNNRYLTQEEVLQIYPFTLSTLYNATRYKSLPYIKHGKHRYYKRIEIEEWIEKNTIINQDKLMLN